MPDPADIVQHIVVLMLENRSFDHMLGYMKSQIPSLNGLDGTEWNPEDASNPVVKVQVSDDAGCLDLVADPSHWTPDVLDQIYSVYIESYTLPHSSWRHPSGYAKSRQTFV